MKTKVHIRFDAEDIPGEAAAILTPTGCGPDVADVSDHTIVNIRTITVRIKLDEGDERVAKVFALLEQYGIEVDSFTYTEYSEEDLQNARLLWLISDPNTFVFAGPQYGTKYDLTNACTNCKAGAKQTSVLYVDNDEIATIRKHRAVKTRSGEVLVDGGMRKKLVDAGITGISFGDVRARHENKKWSMVAREQILIEHTMPPMRGELTAKDEQYLCKVCRRGGRMSAPKKPYRKEDLVGMQDFNLTWEWFGEFWPENKERQRPAKRPDPRILVTPKVMNIFREAGVKSFEWTPVLLQD
jgi:hypothetical protein